MAKTAKVEVRDWRIIDIHFNEVDEDAANVIRKEYEAKGYEYQQTDNAGAKGYDSCMQLMSRTIIKTRRIKITKP